MFLEWFESVLLLSVTFPTWSAPIQIVEIYIGSGSFLNYQAAAPAVEVALEELGEIYPAVTEQLSRQTIFLPGDLDCTDQLARLHEIIGQIWNSAWKKNSFTILFSNGNLLCFQ